MSETLVRMPKLADTLVEGTLGQWLKRVGDTVRPGEPLASIETDKVTTELPSPAAGTLLEVLVSDGQTVPIETPIARIGEPAAAQEASRRADEASRRAEGPSRGTEEASRRGGETSRGVEGSSRPGDERRAGEPVAPPKKATPVAARLLAEHGLKAEDIQTASGRLTKADVLTFVAREASAAVAGVGNAAPGASPARGGFRAPAAWSAEVDLMPLTSMRRAIAEHM